MLVLGLKFPATISAYHKEVRLMQPKSMFGRNLKTLRELKGINQRQLAKAMGV